MFNLRFTTLSQAMLLNFIVMFLCMLSFSNAVANIKNPEPSVQTSSPTAVANNTQLESISLQLKWLHQFQFAGYYAAKIKGFYEEAGLDVTIKPRNIAVNNIEQVINGESEYGIADSMVMLYQAKDAPLSIISVIFQHSPQVFLTLKSSQLDSPYDLTNKKIAFYRKDTDGFPLLAMLHENNINVELERIAMKPSPDVLVSGDIEVYPAYLSNEAYYFYEKGIEINIIHPMNYGIDLYGDLIFTHHNEIENHPERVEKFKQASIKGWHYALQNKEEIINYLINDLGVNKSFEHLMFEAKAIEQAIEANLTPLGSVNKGRLEHIQKLFEKHNLIDTNLNLNDGIYQKEKHELNLSRIEQAWINRNTTVKVAIDPAWQPIEYINEQGEHSGLANDFLTRLHLLTGINFEAQTDKSWDESVTAVKNQEIEMFSAVIETPERNQYLNFTPSFLNFPMVVATLKGENYIRSLAQLSGKQIAVVKNYAAHELIQKNNKNIPLLLVNSVEEGLEAVNNGLAYGYIDNLAVVGYHIRSLGLSNLQITGETPFKADIKMAVIKELPELHSILSKALNSISDKQKAQIANKWLQVEYKREFDWTEIALYLSPATLIVLLMLFYAKKIHRLNDKLKKSNQHLKTTQESLKASNQRLEVLSITDFLTGAHNRQYIDDVIEIEIARATRHQSHFSILLIDLDNFKLVNDQYGHLMGDEVLKKTYQCLASSIRKTDTIGRWGGEEFMVICPETNLKQANLLAKKFLQAIQQVEFEKGIKQTISIGLSEHHKDESSVSLLERADKNLYTAKKQGKNQAVI